jgi:hypothetical protein
MKMKNIRALVLGAAALVWLVPAIPVMAATSPATSVLQLCSPKAVDANVGPRYVVNPATGGGSYSLNQSGCALMQQADWGYFISQGFTAGAGAGSIYVGPYTAQTTASNSPILPANAYIEAIIIQETSGNALTGGLDIGVAGSSDATIASAFAVAANCVCAITAAAILKRVFPTSGVTGPAAQQIFFNAHTSWNSGSINATILFRYY